MGRKARIQTNRFWGGISDDPNQETPSVFQVTKHFDIFTQPFRLTPYRSLEADENDGSSSTGMKQYDVREMILASDAKLYGLGTKSANSNTKVFRKDTPESGNWTVPSSAEGSANVIRGCFVEYYNNLYGFQGTNQVFKYGDITSSPTFTNSAATVGATITSVANGVIAKDDVLYMAYNNIIVSVDSGGTITDNVLTLPGHLKVTSLDTYGNYLAIGCAHKDNPTEGRSIVFLWDLVQDDVTESIDFGDGALLVLAEIEGRLIGVSDEFIDSDLSAGNGAIMIRSWAGGAPQVMKQIPAKANATGALLQWKVKKGSKLYFSAKIPQNAGATENFEGIFVVGRRGTTYPYAVTLDTIDENVDSNGIQGFGNAGNIWFIAHSGDGSIDKTDDSANYNFTSIYESQVFMGDDPAKPKALHVVRVTNDPLPSGGSLTLKYRVDNDSTWKTIFVSDTDDAVSYEAVREEEDSDDAFDDFHSIEFRLESDGGAVPKSLSFDYEEKDDLAG